MADAETWSKRVEEWRSSGLTARDFAEARGCSMSQLYWWSSKLGRQTPRPDVQLARVVRRADVVGASVDAEHEHSAEVSLVLLEIGEVRVFVTNGVQRATLDAVLGALDGRGHGAPR